MSLCPAFLIVNLPDLRELLQSTQQCRPVLECQAREKCINGPGAEGQGARDGNAGLLCKKTFVKKQRAATRAAQIPLDWTFCRGQRYFFSSEGCGAVAAGGAGAACAGGAGVCEAPDMPSLKLRMPSPNPFMISGMRFPPNKIKTITRTINQCIGLSNICILRLSRPVHHPNAGAPRAARAGLSVGL